MRKDDKLKRLGLLVSGNGSNLQAIIEAIRNNTIPESEVSIVISNKKNAYALERAKGYAIPAIYLNPGEYNNAEAYDKKIGEILKEYKVDLILLAGYLKIITPALLELYPEKILNIHPGLLPAFGGVNMYGIRVHEAVIAKGSKKSGCTVHIVTDEVDKGPILDQIEIDVLPDDTPETLAARILNYEHQLYPKVVARYLETLKRSNNT